VSDYKKPLLVLILVVALVSPVSSYTNWASNEPNDQNGEDCAHMYDSGEWNDNNCGDSRIGICEYSDGSYDTTSSMSWSNTRDECESRGGNLLVVEDAQENNNIANSYNGGWIGYKQESGASEPGGGWEWVSPIVGIEVCHHDESGARWECGSRSGDPGDEDKYTSNGWSEWSGFSQSNSDIDGYKVRIFNDGLNQVGVQGKFYDGSGTEHIGEERYTSSGWSSFSSEQSGTSSRGGGARTYMDGACTTTIQWCKHDESRGAWECYSKESTSSGWSGWSEDRQPNDDVNGLRSRIKIESCYTNQAPSVDSIGFSDSASEHRFAVDAVVSDPDGDGDISSCEIRAEGSSNTVTRNGYDTSYGNGNEALCSTMLDYSSFSSHLENLDITVTVTDSAGDTDSSTSSHSFPNHPPSKDNFYFTNSSSDHEFTVTAEASDPDNGIVEINSCEIDWTDEQGNTGSLATTVSGDSPTTCTTIIEDGGNIEVGEQITIDTTMTERHGNALSWSGQNTLINHDPSIVDAKPWTAETNLNFTNYTDVHGFNVTAFGYDTNSGQNEIDSCEFHADDGETTTTVSGDLDTSWGDTDQAKCFYSNINESMPRDGSGDSIEPGFEANEEIEVEARFFDRHNAVGAATDSNWIPNSPAVVRGEEPRNDSLWLEDNAELNISVRDDQDNLLKVYFHNARNDNLLAKDTVTGTIANYKKVDSGYFWRDLDLGKTYKWKVNVSDTIENETYYFEFLRGSTNQYRTQQRIRYKYSSIITTAQNQRQFFFTVENKIDETKTLRTYLTGVNAELEQYGSSISPEYTLNPFEKKQFSVIVKPEENGQKSLDITTENIDVKINTTDSVPVLVRDLPAVGSSRDVPGIGLTQILFLMLVSGLLYSVRL